MTPDISRRTALQTAAALAVGGLATGGTAQAADPELEPQLQPEAAAGGRAIFSEELAHYYRFAEIVEGRRMVRTNGVWAFDGEEIRFDPDGVLAMVDDPDTGALPQGSPERKASERCDAAYSRVLLALGRVFDGHPDELPRAVRAMHELKTEAERLTEIPGEPGSDTVLGPSFRFVDPHRRRRAHSTRAAASQDTAVAEIDGDPGGEDAPGDVDGLLDEYLGPQD